MVLRRLGVEVLLTWACSHFSFLRATSSPEALVDAACSLGWRAMILADWGGVYGMVKAHQRASALGVRVLVGASLPLPSKQGHVILIAQTARGYTQMCEGIAQFHRDGECTGLSQMSDVLCLWHGLHSVNPPDVLPTLRDLFGSRLYLLVTRQRQANAFWYERWVLTQARALNLKCVAGHDVRYHSPTKRPLLDVMRCIERRCTLEQLSHFEPAFEDHAMLSTVEFRRRFQDSPSLIASLDEIAARVTFSLDALHYHYPREFIPNGLRPDAWLRVLAFRGARHRYRGSIPHNVAAQLERELALIKKLKYAGYFLTMSRIVEFCHRRGILCQGRGSAANSVVCYCLEITAVDPVEMGLLFERFLSVERREPPDIDLDIEHERREEVIQFVYARYGTSHAAMVCTIVRFRARSAVREVGRVFGLDANMLGTLSRRVGGWGQVVGEDWAALGVSGDAGRLRHVQRMIEEIQGTPRYISTHPGGFLLGDDAIHTLVPTQPATMPNRTIIQWDKDDVEAMGLFKLDLLGLGALSCIRRAFSLLAEHRQQSLSLATIPGDDLATYQMIQAADTLGVFQIESRAQMSMLPRLKPACFYDLVIEISLVRPGPVAGDMVHPYLRRRQGLEPCEIHPCLAPVLMRTLGVPLFQEQVMRVAMVAGGYSAGEADQLRRDMASWQSPGTIERHRHALTQGMVSRGFDVDFAERLFRQIQGFGSYGFPESHAASFALLAYATAYLRCHAPDVFACALLQSQPMGFYAPHSIVEDARRRGVPVLPVCVKKSQWFCTLEPVPGTEALGLRIGLRWIKGGSTLMGEQLIAQRDASEIVSILDLIRRVPMSHSLAIKLALAGALCCFGVNRRQAFWTVCMLWARRRDALVFEPPSMLTQWCDDDEQGIIERDYAHLGMSAIGHCVLPHRAALSAQGLPTAHELWCQAPKREGEIARFAGVVIGKQRPSTASGTVFVTLEDETGMVNVIIHARMYERHRAMIRLAVVLGVEGVFQYEQGVVHVLAKSFWTPDVLIGIDVRRREFR